MPAPPCTHVRKRDGRLVPFDLAKLTASLEAAARACGCENGFYAQELAEAVMLHLSHACGGDPPETSAVAAAVEHVLTDLNYHRVARAYRAYREQREQQRTRCTVIKPAQPSLFSDELAPHLTVMHSGHSSPWQRSRIVQALMREAHVGRAVAEEIARSVEEKLLASDLRRITTTLIRALTDNELLQRGYTSALLQRSAVTVPFQDVDQLLRHAPDELVTSLGREVLHPYVLSRVYSDDVADAHRRGVIDLGGLDHPLSTYRVASAVPPTADLAALAAELHVWVQRASAACISHVVLHISEETPPASLRQLIELLSGTTRGWRAPWHLTLVLSPFVVMACAELSEDLQAAPECELWCCGETADVHTTVTALLALYRRGWSIAWHPSAAPPPAAQLITINLPQAVYRARQPDLDAVIEELYRSVDIAAHAHRQFRLFQRDHARSLASHPGVLTCLGWDEAVGVLSGSNVFDSDDSLKCARVLLGVIHDAVASVTRALELPLSFRMDERALCGRRFARLDHALFPELFGFLPLHTDALAEVIPPYRPLELALRGQPVASVTHACQQLQRYTADNVVRLNPHGLETSDLLPYALALADARCGFAIAGAQA